MPSRAVSPQALDADQPRPPNRLPAPRSDEVRRIERVLAIARVVLASCALLAIYIDPTQPTSFPRLAYAMLTGYLVYSLAIFACVRLKAAIPARFPVVVHGFDLLWPPVIGLFTEGPSTPFFVFFVFVLLAAAYRWRFRETLATAAVSVALIVISAALISHGGLPVPDVVDPGWLVMRVSYLLLMGFLLGFLAEDQKENQAQTEAVARMLRAVRVELGLRRNLHIVAQELLRIFGAHRLLLLVRGEDAARAYLWEATPGDGRRSTLTVSELTPRNAQTYLFDAPGATWFIKRQGNGGATIVRTLDAHGRSTGKVEDRSAPTLHFDEIPFEYMLAVEFRVSKEWSGRLFLLDPHTRWNPEKDMRLLSSLFSQVAPVLYGVYLQGELRFQAGAIERTRVARELHDGVIQSLIGVEMELEALRRGAGDTAQITGSLSHIQRVLRQEVVSLRELLQQMKPIDLGPENLLDFMASTIDRFQQEVGIAARFHSELEEVSLPPRTCHEIARILQEALVNIRKHSGARNVLVRLGSENGHWLLEITDDGCGFGFAGTVLSSQPDAARKAPVILSERVRSLHGELAIESTPGRGARLTITFPRQAHG